MMRLILATAIVVFSFTNLFAQNQLNNFTYSVSYVNPTYQPAGDTNSLARVVILVKDTLQVSAVKVDVGSFLGGADVFSYTFSVGQNVGLPANCAIFKDTDKISIELGYYPPSIHYYRVKLYDLNGNSSDGYIYNSISNSFIWSGQ